MLIQNCPQNISVKILTNKSSSHNLLIFLAIFFAFFSFVKNSYAVSGTEYGLGRTRSCNANNGTPEGLDFSYTNGGKDIEFNLSNPVCLAVIATTYAAVKTEIAAMDGICGIGSAVPRVTPSPILDAVDIARASAKCASTQNASCCAATVLGASTYATALAELYTVYSIAKDVYKVTSICGSNWNDPSPSTYTISGGGRQQEVQDWVEVDIENTNGANLNMDHQEYREWYYGGVEVSDSPNDTSEATCLDPSDNDKPQKYYLTGTNAGNYNCSKYLAGALNKSDSVLQQKYLTAYNCCKKRSQKFICINYHGDAKFCAAGTLCTFNNHSIQSALGTPGNPMITFSTVSLDNGSLICASSYSLCPYNFNIGGGSEYCDYYQDGIWDSDKKRWNMITQEDVDAGNCANKSEIRKADCTYNTKAGACRNYCQYLTHCTRTSASNYIYNSSLTSPYFSSACIDFIGDSQNNRSYGGNLIGNQKHFSAPIAQCVRETMENVFYNRVGHSECATYGEYPSSDGTCPSGTYATDGGFVYKKGNQAYETSFFASMQDSVQDVVKAVLSLSIMFLGIKTLLGMSALNKKDLMIYLLKLSLVLYFATGDAWQSTFFNGIYGASSEFSQIVFKITSVNDESKRDGCQFGEITLENGDILLAGNKYSPGKEYLALWDTLDCKMMVYLGFGPEISVANITLIIIAGLFSGPLGIYFSMSLMFFGFFMIAAAIRALHIFLASAMSIIILVFISPLAIPCVLFSRTTNIFNGWLSKLISYSLQPVILFAYIAVFCTVFDQTMIGSATFHGNPPYKAMYCKQFCQNSDGSVEPNVDGNLPKCDQPGQQIIDPMNDSFACLIGFNKFGKAPGFELIGIGLPMMKNIFLENGRAKILTVLKAALIIYLLCKFMDEIPQITSALVGGGLPESKRDAFELFKKAAGLARTIQQRGAGAIWKHGRGIARRGAEKMKEVGRIVGDRGKSVSDLGPTRGGDHSGKSAPRGSDHITQQGSADKIDKT